ncbi:TPA: hypothetical protein ACGORX_001713 [Streptococcus suis]
MSNCEIARLLRNNPKTIHNEFNPGTTLQQVRKGWDKNIDSIVYGQTVYQIIRNRSVKRLMLTNKYCQSYIAFYKVARVQQKLNNQFHVDFRMLVA